MKYVAINDVMAEAGRLLGDEDQFSLDEDSDSGKSLFRSSLTRDRIAKCTMKQLETQHVTVESGRWHHIYCIYSLWCG